LRLNIEFQSAGSDGRANGRGTTRNVSAGGIYFRTPSWQELEPGTILQVKLSGFGQYDVGPIFRSLEGEAEVLRLNPPVEKEEDNKAGVALRFQESPQFDTYRRTRTSS